MVIFRELCYDLFNIYLCSNIIIVEAAAMIISLLLKVREIIRDEDSLVTLTKPVLRYFGGGVSSSSEDDRASQVDGTGMTTMIMFIIASQLIITVFHILTQIVHLMCRPPLSSHLSSHCRHLPAILVLKESPSCSDDT